MQTYALAFLVAVILTGVVRAETPATNPEAEVARASDAFMAARQQGDAAAFTSLFTEDGVFMVPGLPDAAGRAAIRALAEKRFKGVRTKDIEISRRDIDVRGDTAYELAWYAETDERQEESYRMRARHFLQWKRESDGAWRVRRYLYNFSGAEPLP